MYACARIYKHAYTHTSRSQLGIVDRLTTTHPPTHPPTPPIHTSHPTHTYIYTGRSHLGILDRQTEFPPFPFSFCALGVPPVTPRTRTSGSGDPFDEMGISLWEMLREIHGDPLYLALCVGDAGVEGGKKCQKRPRNTLIQEHASVS